MAENKFQSLGGEYSFPDWNTLFNSIPHPTVVLNKERAVIAANRKVVDLLNKPLSEILSMKCWQLFHNPNLTHAPERCCFEKMLSTNSIETTEMELEVFGGWYIVSYTPIINKAGLLDGVIHIAVDITDRKRLESQLEQSLKEHQSLSIMLETIFDAIPDIIGIQELDHRIIRYNKAGYDYLQSSPETVNGKKCFQLIGRDKPCDVCATSEVYKTMKPSHKYRYIPEISRWIEIRAYPVMGKEGNLEKVIEHLRDITDIKKAEQEKKAIERQIQQLEKLESLGILAGGIAHDFNNLLAGIFGYVDMARLESTDPKVQNYLEITLKTMNRARNLTQQLLTFAKGGSPDKKVMTLEVFLDETARFALSGTKSSLAISCEPGLWPCAFDSSQMAQVIDNILINAQQAMPNGGTVTIHAKNKLIENSITPDIQDGRYIEIAICDTGIGIPESIRSKIFDPFFTTKQKGSGLGLATAYSIVKRHGGNIAVASSPDIGSTFTILLPATNAGTKKEPDQNVEGGTGTGRILVMDDEEVVRGTMSVMLRRSGFDPVVCENGKAAIDIFERSIKENEPFAALLLDLTVPGGMGGNEVIRHIRKTDKNIPAIVSSGYSDDPIMQTPKEYGFTDCLKKPFGMADLIGLLRKYI